MIARGMKRREDRGGVGSGGAKELDELGLVDRARRAVARERGDRRTEDAKVLLNLVNIVDGAS